jgi:DNA-binding transcriptional ArsR family regulator
VNVLIGRLANEIQETPRLVVIDTLARCFEGSENETEDMGRFVAGVDQLRHEYGATVLVVHHTRLDGDRERGNTAFRGGTDTMIAVKRKGEKAPITLECTKQKDAEAFPELTMRLKAVAGTESCVVTSDPATHKVDNRSIILSLLEQSSELSYKDLVGLTQRAGMSLPTLKRHLVSLKENGEIIKKNNKYTTI